MRIKSQKIVLPLEISQSELLKNDKQIFFLPIIMMCKADEASGNEEHDFL